MADIKHDLLGLEYSRNFSINGMQEADIDLNLSPVTDTSATVHGKVTDGTNPLPDATVKLFDSKGLPFKHTLTNSNGEYTLDGVPAGTYSIGTVKNGYRLSDTVGVTLSDSDTTEINFICTPDATLALGAIVGILTHGEYERDSTPLSNAKITLMDINNNVIATTFSVNDGEFAFYVGWSTAWTAAAFAKPITQKNSSEIRRDIAQTEQELEIMRRRAAELTVLLNGSMRTMSLGKSQTRCSASSVMTTPPISCYLKMSLWDSGL